LTHFWQFHLITSPLLLSYPSHSPSDTLLTVAWSVLTDKTCSPNNILRFETDQGNESGRLYTASSLHVKSLCFIIGAPNLVPCSPCWQPSLGHYGSNSHLIPLSLPYTTLHHSTTEHGTKSSHVALECPGLLQYVQTFLALTDLASADTFALFLLLL
jgi:hypothetical protein